MAVKMPLRETKGLTAIRLKPLRYGKERGVGRQGFEPWTLGLKVRCSNQAELPARVNASLGVAERRS